MNYLELKKKIFLSGVIALDRHIYGLKKGKWKLRHNVNKTGEDD